MIVLFYSLKSLEIQMNNRFKWHFGFWLPKNTQVTSSKNTAFRLKKKSHVSFGKGIKYVLSIFCFYSVYLKGPMG